MFGYRKTFRCNEKQSVAIFIALHLLAGTDPSFLVNFRLLVLIEVAWTQWFSEFVCMFGKTDYWKFRDFPLRMKVGSTLIFEALYELPHLGYGGR